jgi:hypothetical protein
MTEANYIKKDEFTKVLEILMSRAAVDLDFRNLCLENPYQALYEVSGRSIPTGTVKLVFASPEETHVIMLPKFLSEHSTASESDIKAALAKYELGKVTQPCLPNLSA